MANPVRLINSAKEARGNETIRMHGEVLPIEVDRMRAVNDGDTIWLSRQQALTFMDAPGHAPHQVCIFEARNGGVFSGDAVAVYIPECDILLPFHPPPDFDLKLCINTMERLKGFSAHKIYYSHFGTADQVQEHLDRAREKLMLWESIIGEAAQEGALADSKKRLIDQARADMDPMKSVSSLAPLYDYLLNVHIPMCADGHIKYYRDTLNYAPPELETNR